MVYTQGFDHIETYVDWIYSNQCLISGDSLGLHLASLFRIPWLGVFKATSPEEIPTTKFDKKLSLSEMNDVNFPAGVLIWEQAPFAITVELLETEGLRSIAFATGGNRPAEGDYLDLMRWNLGNLAKLQPVASNGPDSAARRLGDGNGLRAGGDVARVGALDPRLREPLDRTVQVRRPR